MGSMGRPIQPKKIIATSNKKLKPVAGFAKSAAHLAETKHVCKSCGNVFLAKAAGLQPLKCPKCDAVVK